jgi:hypothetical protein
MTKVLKLAVRKDAIIKDVFYENTEGRGDVYLHPFLTSALDGIGYLTPRVRRFTLCKDPVPISDQDGWASGPV